MAIATYFHPKALSADQYDQAIRDLEAARQAFEAYGPVLMPILQKVGIDPGTPDVMPVHSLTG